MAKTKKKRRHEEIDAEENELEDEEEIETDDDEDESGSDADDDGDGDEDDDNDEEEAPRKKKGAKSGKKRKHEEEESDDEEDESDDDSDDDSDSEDEEGSAEDDEENEEDAGEDDEAERPAKSSGVNPVELVTALERLLELAKLLQKQFRATLRDVKKLGKGKRAAKQERGGNKVGPFQASSVSALAWKLAEKGAKIKVIVKAVKKARGNANYVLRVLRSGGVPPYYSGSYRWTVDESKGRLKVSGLKKK